MEGRRAEALGCAHDEAATAAARLQDLEARAGLGALATEEQWERVALPVSPFDVRVQPMSSAGPGAGKGWGA